MKTRYGFCSHKLKGGVFQPEYELEAYHALAEAFPDDSLRYDPNAALSVAESLWFAKQIRGLRNDYLEDPIWGLQGMRQVCEKATMLLATNTVVVNFKQLCANLQNLAVNVVLFDATFRGGIRPCIKAAGV